MAIVETNIIPVVVEAKIDDVTTFYVPLMIVVHRRECENRGQIVHAGYVGDDFMKNRHLSLTMIDTGR